MLSSLSAIFMKCFTRNTLVATEDGDKRIDEIAVGDSVWAEGTVTGEQVLRRVSKVYVKETDHLIHIGTSIGEDIETTENHPFYTEERGWVAASELEEGETLHTEDGSVVTVTYNRDEWLKEPVKVYNLEVEGLHTYYVTVDRVLVHNIYGDENNINVDKSQLGKKFSEHAEDYNLPKSKEGVDTYKNIISGTIENAEDVRHGKWMTLGDCDFYIYDGNVTIVCGNEWVSTFPLTREGIPQPM